MEGWNWLRELKRPRVVSSMARSKCSNVIRDVSFSSFQLSFTLHWFHSLSASPGCHQHTTSLYLTTLAAPWKICPFPTYCSNKKFQAYSSLAGLGHVSTFVLRPGARAKNERSMLLHPHRKRVGKCRFQRIRVLFPREGE